MPNLNTTPADGGPALAVRLDGARLKPFCQKWAIRDLSVFGSVLRPHDFTPDSDVDFLVSFEPLAGWSLLDHAAMEAQLADVVGRPVHPSTRRAVEGSRNWIRRNEILGTAKQVFPS